MKPSARFLLVFLVGAAAVASAPRSARAGGQQPVPGAVAALASGAVPADPGAAASGSPGADTAELRSEVERLRALVERQERALESLQRRLELLAPVSPAAERSVTMAEPTPTAAAPPSAVADDELKKQVEELAKRWGKLRLSGDVQLRAESFFNQGFDGPELKPRNRFRLRARLQVAGEISKNFDWGIRFASGSFDNPVSPQQSFTDSYTRKPFALDRAYIRFTSKTDPVDLELVGGKFEPIWKRTGLTLDQDLQPEGFAQNVRFKVGADTPLRSVRLTAWQLPFRERSVGADAVLLGGQFHTEWKWSDNWSTTLSGAFHDFEQVDVIPPVTGVSPTLVNAGFDYATTNTVAVNPFTNLPEYRSEFRVVDAIAEVKYTGLAERWPLTITANWLHNTSAFNNQKDGGVLIAEFGRRQDKGDLAFDYWFWKAEREVYPSVFMDSEMVIQTNSLSHAVKASYLVHRQVQLDFRYLVHRRLQTISPVNRWLNHVQFDVNYRF